MCPAALRVFVATLVAFLIVMPGRRVRAGGKAMEGVVNVNTAPAATLALIPGFGPAKVQSILEYRQRRPFRTVDELVRIKGISSKMVRRLRPHLAATGPSTARVLTGREAKAAAPVVAAPPVGDKKTAAAVGASQSAAARPPIKASAGKSPTNLRPARRREIWARASLCLPAP